MLEPSEWIALFSFFIALSSMIFTVCYSKSEKAYRLLSIQPRFSIDIDTRNNCFKVFIANYGAGYGVYKDLMLVHLKTKKEFNGGDDLNNHISSWFLGVPHDIETFSLSDNHISGLSSGERIQYISVSIKGEPSADLKEVLSERAKTFVKDHGVYMSCSDVACNEKHYFISDESNEIKQSRGELTHFSS